MKFIDEVNIENQKVILRCDYNVSIKDNHIVDNTRIVKSLKTIQYLIDKNCSIIIMSHMGRIKVPEDRPFNSLALVAEELNRLLNKEVHFINEPVGNNVLNYCLKLEPGEIVLLENTRYCDFPEKLESNNDLELAKYWSKLGNIFVVDAFGSLHRAHASVAGISNYLPTYFGFLVKEEMTNLKPLIENVERPFTVFMGGAKVDDKLNYIKGLLNKCDYLLIGGGIANSFLYACGYDVQDSLCTTDEMTLSEIRSLIKEYKNKIIMPIDFVIDDNKILDLNQKSINKYKKYLEMSKTIFINGTCGKFEEEAYSKGTIDLFESLSNVQAYKVAGGGDTLKAINQFNLQDNFSYLSSGGGAAIEYISNNTLEAIEYINVRENNRQ